MQVGAPAPTYVARAFSLDKTGKHRQRLEKFVSMAILGLVAPKELLNLTRT